MAARVFGDLAETPGTFPIMEPVDRRTAVLEIVKILLETLNPGEVADFLATSCEYLDGQIPIDLLYTQYERVLEAAKAFRASS